MEQVTTELPRRANLKFGQRVFSEASITYPVSNVAQGAYIAKKCLDQGIVHPINLGEALARDEAGIALLIRAAKNIHTKHGINLVVTPEAIRDVIGADFRNAERFSQFTQGELDSILQLYSTLRNNRKPIDQIDDLLADFAANILAKYENAKTEQEIE